MAGFFASTLARREGGAPLPANAFDWAALLAPDAPRSPAGWTVPEAFVAILFAAVTCDGEIAAVEHEELLALVHRSRALKSLSVRDLSAINVKVAGRLRDEPGALRAACAALPEDMRLPVFAHALDLILADGELTIDEADFLNALILNLDLAREDVARISDVIVMKNRY